MRISLEWISDYVKLPQGLKPEQIKYDLTMSTVEVEQVVDLSRQLRKVVTARVKDLRPHPDSPKLWVVVCDAGGKKTVEVVCGAENLSKGQWVALALPGATVLPRHGKGPTVVEESAVRGVGSHGMICGASELGLEKLFPPADEMHIMDLEELAELEAGRSLAAAIGFEDVILEIDNKSLTNRPDLLGHRGIGRELAAIYKCPLEPPPTFQPPRRAGGLAVSIENPARCRRYTATRIESLSAGPSPFWLRSRLVRVEQGPINFLVDLTNYIMLSLGQPSHAFDIDQLHGTIEIRQARKGEKLELLDETTYELAEEDLVIADEESAVALAGIMGGRSTSIRDDTDEIVLEIANFEASGVRRTSSKLNVTTDSSMRFEKGLDPVLIDDALALFCKVLFETQPEAEATGFVDNFPAPIEPPAVKTTVEFINRRLGAQHSEAEVCAMLERLGFGVSCDRGHLTVQVPSWRATGDVSLPEDLVEEVGRLYGYENLEFFPPVVKLERSIRQPRLSLERRIREYLAGPGSMREIVSYPWVEERYLEAAGMNPPLGLTSPPAPDTQGLQPSLIPQMLWAVASNLRFFQEFRIFQVARVFPSSALTVLHEGGEKLPPQPKHLSAALVGKDADRLFLEAKGILEALGREVQMEPLGLSGEPEPVSWAEPAGQLTVRLGEESVGRLGAVSARTMRLAGIRRSAVALLEIDLTRLQPLPSRENRYQAIPRFPQNECDLSLVLPVEVRWADLHDVLGGAHPLVLAVQLIEEYRGDPVPAGKKSLLVRATIGSSERTLEGKDLEEVREALVKRAEEEFELTLRSL